MKTKYFNFILLFTFIFNISCEDLLDTNSKSIIEKIEGTWKCEESSSLFKSTQDFYTVYISPSASDSTQVLISNFYDLGSGVEAVGRVTGTNISLATQTLLGGFKIRGSGTISENAQQINWTYYVDDGSGEEDEVNAVYTFQY
ncbi:MAG: hypothetical protein JXA77_17130 [Bacteroidales bacterium]|nr:hypothetical protein [Bacteroidales bacterium]MBN2819426.1 hypothetical protein [Bacteroidales bacterium]